ncbi:MAG: hypothetical protein QM784_06140 [Polyangiaceae bacterium]
MAAQLARHGTTSSRLAALSILLAVLVIATLVPRAWGSRSLQPERLLRGIVRKIDPSLSSRIHRALGLVRDAVNRPGQVSLELAELHLDRALAQLPFDRIRERGWLLARRANVVAAALTVAGLAVVLWDPGRVFEGANVLLSRQGRAPWSTEWLELAPTMAQLPGYLHEPAQVTDFGTSTPLPRGSVLTVRGVPRVEGRIIVLTNGSTEVPFVSDGRGGVSARFQLMDDTRLYVAARFGTVLVYQKDVLELTAVVDEPPEVELEGAPGHVDSTQVSEIELNYRVRDDHGVSSVELRLRSGTQVEERRLVSLDGERRRFSGSHLLKLDDPFIAQSTDSVEVTIAARDGNDVDGPKTGVSPIMILGKASVGQLQQRRYVALRQLRDSLVDWFAQVSRRGSLAESRVQHDQRVLPALKGYLALVGSKARADAFTRRFVQGQLDKLTPERVNGPKGTDLLAEAALAMDALLEVASQRDAEMISRQLGSIADEVEQGAKEVTSSERRAQGEHRVKSATARLKAGSETLLDLGALGADLGQIALAGVDRINRCREREDYVNVARAASFLAERLKRPRASFVGGMRPSVESGMPRRGGAQNSSGERRASEADTRLERVSNELRQLSDEHRTVMESVQQLVEQTEQANEADSPTPEMQRRAEELRRLVQELPRAGGEPGSGRAAAALAKELTFGGAESLSQGKLGAALDGLRQAEGAFAEVERVGWTSPTVDPSALTRMRQQLQVHRSWVENQLSQRKEDASRRVSSQFRDWATKERSLRDRARAIVDRESRSDAVLPEEIKSDLEQASRWMNEASLELEGTRGRRALEQQEKAQSLLERSEPSEETESGSASGAHGPGSRRSGVSDERSVVAPTADAEGRERFRRRVLEGLGTDLPPSSTSRVRRYVEGLLR